MALILDGSNGITSPGGDTTSLDSTFHTIKVGLGGGSVASNTAVGNVALVSNVTGSNNSAFGQYAGQTNQGTNSILIGSNTSSTFSNTVIIDGANSTLVANTAGFFANPIRNTTNSNVLYYNSSSKEITYGSTNYKCR